MFRLAVIFATTSLFLAACAAPPPPTLGPDGRPLPRVYRISAGDSAEIQFRMLDSINALRQAAGAAPVQLSSELTAAAATHSRDMAVQNRPWHFGSDGSSPIDRIQRVGYQGNLVGETISETFETETETLAAWVQLPQTREVLLDTTATRMGISWFQEPGGKIWWTLVLGN